MKLHICGDGNLLFIEQTVDEATRGAATVTNESGEWEIGYEIHAAGKSFMTGGSLCSNKKPWAQALGIGMAKLHRELMAASSVPENPSLTLAILFRRCFGRVR
jgi:hypothetical protein